MAAETADRVVAQLEARNGRFNADVKQSAQVFDQSMTQIERGALRAEAAVARASTQISRQTAAAANASRNLGRQVSDIGVGLASGQSPFLILAQQAPQVADALSDTGGKAAAVASFFAGPWGAALLAAGSTLAVFSTELFKSEKGLEDQVRALEENARKTALAEIAKAAFAKTEQGLISSVGELTTEIKKQNDELRTNGELLNVRAKTTLFGLQRARPDAVKGLADAERDLEVARRAAQGTEAGLSEVARLSAKVKQARERLADLDKAIADAQAAVSFSRAQLADEAAKRAVDPVEQIRRKYEGPDGLIEQAKKRARAEGQVTTELTKQITLLRTRMNAEIEAAEKRRSSSSRAPNITPKDVSSLLTDAFGGTITSTTGGKHVPGSYHYRGQAVDFVPRGGVGAVSKQQIRDVLAAAGVPIKELLGPGDKGHSDHFHVAFGKTRGGTDDYARRKEAEAARKAEERERNQESFEDQRSRLDQQILAAKGQQVISLEEQAKHDVAAVEAEAKMRDVAIQRQLDDKKISDEQAKELRARSATVAELEKSAIAVRLRRMQDERERSISRDLQQTLSVEADLIDVRTARLAVELEILALREKEEASALESAIAAGQIADAEAARANLARRQSARRQGLTEDFESPFQAYSRRLKRRGDNIGDEVQSLVVQRLDEVDDAIASAIADKLGVKDPLLQQLLALFIEQNLLRPIADALAQAQAAGGGGGSFFSSLVSAAGTIFGRASGGYVGPGQVVRVNEQAGGVELLKMGSQGGKVIPLGQARAQRGGGMVQRVYQITVRAENSVTPAGFAQGLAQQILAEAARMDAQASKATRRQSIGDQAYFQDTGNVR